MSELDIIFNLIRGWCALRDGSGRVMFYKERTFPGEHEAMNLLINNGRLIITQEDEKRWIGIMI